MTTKILVGDKVVVVKSHELVDGKFIAHRGTLTEMERGLRAEKVNAKGEMQTDDRAYAMEGDCPQEATTDAKGWSVVTTDEGRRVSVHTKELKLDTQSVQVEHLATMALVVEKEAQMHAEAQKVADAMLACKNFGLDVSEGSLSAENAVKIAVLFPAGA